jgi:hypothetical protein
MRVSRRILSRDSIEFRNGCITVATGKFFFRRVICRSLVTRSQTWQSTIFERCLLLQVLGADLTNVNPSSVSASGRWYGNQDAGYVRSCMPSPTDAEGATLTLPRHGDNLQICPGRLSVSLKVSTRPLTYHSFVYQQRRLPLRSAIPHTFPHHFAV